MTEPEARQVLREHAGENLCVRYCHDGAGNIRFRDARPARASVLAMALAACTPHQQQEPEWQVMGGAEKIVEPEPVLMGDVPAPEPNEVEEPPPVMGEPAIPPEEELGPETPAADERRDEPKVTIDPCEPGPPTRR